MDDTQNQVEAEKPAVTPQPDFDGIICFGGLDWWYHNRGHYDMQMMREMSRRMPVLYVNSIGMRTPRISEGRMFFKRVKRKLKSFTRGLQVVSPGFGVFSAVTAPGLERVGLRRRWLALQVRRAARRMGISRPLIWVACPPGVETLDLIPHAKLVYQRTDRFEAFPGVNRDQISGYDRELKQRADATLFCSSLLFETERDSCRNAVFVDHGVDFDRFRDAAAAGDEPADVKELPRPRVGFVGSIDAHTFDPELFLDVAAKMKHCSFVLVGACSLPEGWCQLPNVHLLGQRPYEQVAAYMAACDVLIMPWNKSDWIKACNPVKLKEYLAAGRPVVTTPFYEAKRYSDSIAEVSDANEFAIAIDCAVQEPRSQARLQERVQNETWTAKASAIISIFAQRT